MASYEYDLAVIGGGAAGLTVTAGAAQLGARTLLIEKEPALGGDCLHYGCVPSKTLIRSARVFHHCKRAEDFGLPAMAQAEVDFRQVARRIRGVIATIQEHDSPQRFRNLGARVEFGTPTFKDDHSLLLNGRTVSAKNIVIATGSSPAPADDPVLDNISCITNREIFSLEELPASLIILGAGPIAIEMAQAFCRLGSKVTVIQRSGQILSKEDKDMADLIMETLAGEGVTFHLRATVVSAREQQGQQILVVRSQDGVEHEVRGDKTLLARGRVSNLHDLQLDRAGIACDRGSLVVDQRLRTNQKHIYGAGDVTGGFRFTHAAGYEGGIVVSNTVFHLPRKADYTWMPWCTYTDPELASIGMNENAAAKAGLEYQVWTEKFALNDRAQAEGATNGKLKMLLDRKENVLGVQIAGPGAGDLIGEWAALLNRGIRLSSLAGAVHPYPTLAEINKKVAGTYISSKLFSDLVKKGLKLLFRLQGPVDGPHSP